MQVLLDTTEFWKDFELVGSRLQVLVRNAHELDLQIVSPRWCAN